MEPPQAPYDAKRWGMKDSASMTSTSYRSPPAGAYRSSARPTSGGRHNQPQAQRTFRLAQLPTGASINVSARLDNDGGTRAAGDPAFVTSKSQAFGCSTQRSDYREPIPDAWKRPTTSRFGMSNKPWAAKVQTPGVVPVIPLVGEKMRHGMTRTSTQDTYRAPYPLLDQPSSRAGNIAQGGSAAITGPDADAIMFMIAAGAQPYVAQWLESAPIFEGEVIKRLMREVSTVLRDGADSPDAAWTRAGLAPTKSSKWTGSVSAV